MKKMVFMWDVRGAFFLELTQIGCIPRVVVDRAKCVIGVQHVTLLEEAEPETMRLRVRLRPDHIDKPYKIREIVHTLQRSFKVREDKITYKVIDESLHGQPRFYSQAGWIAYWIYR